MNFANVKKGNHWNKKESDGNRVAINYTMVYNYNAEQ